MSFMLGSFSSGLFGGAESVSNLYGSYQNLTQNQKSIDAGNTLGQALSQQDQQALSSNGATAAAATGGDDSGYAATGNSSSSGAPSNAGQADTTDAGSGTSSGTSTASTGSGSSGISVPDTLKKLSVDAEKIGGKPNNSAIPTTPDPVTATPVASTPVASPIVTPAVATAPAPAPATTTAAAAAAPTSALPATVAAPKNFDPNLDPRDPRALPPTQGSVGGSIVGALGRMLNPSGGSTSGYTQTDYRGDQVWVPGSNGLGPDGKPLPAAQSSTTQPDPAAAAPAAAPAGPGGALAPSAAPATTVAASTPAPAAPAAPASSGGIGATLKAALSPSAAAATPPGGPPASSIVPPAGAPAAAPAAAPASQGGVPGMLAPFDKPAGTPAAPGMPAAGGPPGGAAPSGAGMRGAAAPAPGTTAGAISGGAIPASPPGAAGAGAPAGGAIAASAMPAPNPQGAQNAAKPQLIASMQRVQTPAPKGDGIAVTIPASVAPIVPNQASPTVQSEPTPSVIKPPIDPRPMQALREQAPQWAQQIDTIAARYNVNPQRLAAGFYAESSFNPHPVDPTGQSSAKGAMQITDPTRKTVDPNGTMDPHNLLHSLDMGARTMAAADREFGKDTANSVIAYNVGLTGAHRIATKMQADPTSAMNDPDVQKGLAYGQKMFAPGTQLGASNFVANINPPDPKGAVTAAAQGPGNFLRTLYTTGRQGGGVISDKLRSAEANLISVAAARGDYGGIAHARDMVLQISQRGMQQNVMNADRALSSGDTYGAAQYLAQGHAYFPDGAIGQFAVDNKGQLWGQRVDEGDPTVKLGSPFQVTHDSLVGLLNQSRDPQTYVQNVQAQQKMNSELQMNAAKANMYLSGPADRLQGVEIAAASRRESSEEATLARQQNQQQHDDTLRWQTEQNNASRQAIAQERANDQQKQAQKDQAGYQKEADSAFGPDAQVPGAAPNSVMPGAQRATASQLYVGMRSDNLDGMTTGTVAHYAASGLANGSLKVIPTRNGSFAVVDPKDSGRALTYLSAKYGPMLRGMEFHPAAQQAIGSRPAYGFGNSAIPVTTPPPFSTASTTSALTH